MNTTLLDEYLILYTLFILRVSTYTNVYTFLLVKNDIFVTNTCLNNNLEPHTERDSVKYYFTRYQTPIISSLIRRLKAIGSPE